MTKRLLVMAGGTGGHVFPGLAVADYLAEQGWQVQWLGTAERLEAKLVPEAGYPIHFIQVQGVRGNGVLRLLKAPWQIAKAVWQARKVLKAFAPDVVLGMGGFASGPGGVAAWLNGIPLVIHEQNAVAGLTNRWLSRLAKRSLSGFAMPAPFEWVGNPVRAAFARAHPMQGVSKTVNILVIGGSLGARVLNQQLPIALSQFSTFVVRHQCGAGNRQQVTEAYKQALAGVEHSGVWQVDEFIDDMPEAYQWADLIICRAGALTVAEIAAVGRAAIFVPLPHAVDDHQTLNASALVNANAAWLLPQNQLEEGKLVTLLNDIFTTPSQLLDKAARAKHLAKLHAAAQVGDICKQLAEQK